MDSWHRVDPSKMATLGTGSTQARWQLLAQSGPKQDGHSWHRVDPSKMATLGLSEHTDTQGDCFFLVPTSTFVLGSCSMAIKPGSSTSTATMLWDRRSDTTNPGSAPSGPRWPLMVAIFCRPGFYNVVLKRHCTISTWSSAAWSEVRQARPQCQLPLGLAGL